MNENGQWTILSSLEELMHVVQSIRISLSLSHFISHLSALQ